MTKLVRKAVFPVAGMGTRLLPATKAMPKEMVPIVDTPLIQYALEEARSAGIEEFIFVTARGKTVIEDHFDVNYELSHVLVERNKAAVLESIRHWMPEPGQLTFTRQQQPLGLGHAVWCARNMIGDEPFAVLLADDLIFTKRPCLQQMLDAHAHTGGNMVAVMDVPRSDVSRYGILDASSRSGRTVAARGLVEKPAVAEAPSTLAVVGRYILQPEIFTHLERLQPGAGNEIQLTDAIARMIDGCPLTGYVFEGQRFDCGDRLGFLEANIALSLARSDVGPAVERMMERYRPRRPRTRTISAGPSREPAVMPDLAAKS
jgi:UTP--glucose-1-phosphate uridylyltransferase